MQATGSDQDKPLGSQSGLFSAGRIKRTHTSLSICLPTHICPYFPRLSGFSFFFFFSPRSPLISLCFCLLCFIFSSSWFPGWGLMKCSRSKKDPSFGAAGGGEAGFSGSCEPRVFVETWSTLCPPPSYTSVSHLHHGSKFRRTGGAGVEACSICFSFAVNKDFVPNVWDSAFRADTQPIEKARAPSSWTRRPRSALWDGFATHRELDFGFETFSVPLKGGSATLVQRFATTIRQFWSVATKLSRCLWLCPGEC